MEEKPTKVLVLLPEFEVDALEILPFLSLLKEEFQEAEINLLVHEKDREDLFFLDPSFKIFIFKEHEKGLLGGHKFSVNLKDVFNITHFFNLDTGLYSSMFGLHFRAKNRIGYKSSLDRVFYTHGYSKPQGLRRDQQHVRLLEYFLDKSFETYRIPSFEKKLYEEDFFKASKENKEMTLFWRNFEPSFDEFSFWRDLLLDLKETTVHLISIEDNEYFTTLKEEIALVEVIGKIEKVEDLKTNFQTSQFFISDDPFASRMASMYGLKSILVTPNIRQPQSYFHFLAEPARMSLPRDGGGFFLGQEGEELFEDTQELIDIIFKDLEV